MQDHPPTEILVLRSGAVGDCILTTPTLRALRRGFPAAHITLLGDPFSADVFAHSPDIDTLIKVSSSHTGRMAYLAALLRLRRDRMPLVLDMHGNGRTMVQSLVIGGGHRISFHSSGARQLAYQDTVPDRRDVHFVLRQAEILRPLGIPMPDRHTPLTLAVTPQERSEASELLRARSLPGKAPYVVLHPTAGVHKRRLKQWLPERYAELSDLIQRDLGLRVVITGHGADERPMVDAILRRVESPVIDLFGQTPMRVLSAILAGARLYVGCDTGPMHLASAVDTPVVALFGPTDPDRWHPWSRAPFRVVRLGLPCSPCPGITCPFNARCLGDLEVGPVYDAVLEVIHSALETAPVFASAQG